MKCLRCGYCCINYPVVIIDNPEIGLTDESNLILHKGDGACKHLVGNKPGEYSCAIHEYPWFKKTPCNAHAQVEHKESDCRIGSYFMKQKIKGG